MKHINKCYLDPEDYPVAEIKHRPIASVESEFFTIALLSENMLFEKTKSNMEELGAIDSTLSCISSHRYDKADNFIMLQKFDNYMLEFSEMIVPTQLLAMETV